MSKTSKIRSLLEYLKINPIAVDGKYLDLDISVYEEEIDRLERELNHYKKIMAMAGWTNLYGETEYPKPPIGNPPASIIQQQTAKRCADLIREVDSREWFKNQSMMADAMEEAIRKEFGV